MPHSPHTATPAVRLLRALGSLIALAVLLVGVPAVLAAAGTLPSHVPSLTELWDTVTSQDDGQRLMEAFTLLAWALWGWFCLSFLFETAALLLRRPRRRPGPLAAPQRLAAFLLGSLLLLPAGTAMAASAPAVAATAPHLPAATPTPTPAAPTGTPVEAAGEQAETAPVHVVGETGETVWDLAREYLGDGRRFEEIRRLNPALPESVLLPAGTRVTMPADAHLPSQRPQTPAPAHDTPTQDAAAPKPAAPAPTGHAAAPHTATEEAGSYTVQPADTLWGIAGKEMGDPAAYPKIVAANPAITDPDLIYPGEHLTLPGTRAAQPPATPTPSTPPSRTDPSTPPTPAPSQDTHHDAPPSAAPSAQPSAPAATPNSPAPHATPTAPYATPRTPAPDHTPAPTPQSQPAGHATSAVGVAGLVATGFLAAGVLSLVAYRRIMQRRRLKRDRMIVMPSGRIAQTEIRLRSVDASVELQLLDAMLRTAATRLSEQGRALPVVTAVQLGSEGVQLHLAEPCPPVAPFTANPQQHAQWWCPADTTELLDTDALSDVDPPYPGLIALGDTDGAIVLVDLEHLGALHLTGSRRQQVLRSLGIALALSPLSGGQLEVAVAGEDTAPGLPLLDPERITTQPALAAVLQALHAHQAEQLQALDMLDADDLAHARTDQDASALWPMVALADLDECPDPQAVDGLWELLAQQPRAALGILTSSSHANNADISAAWTLDTDAEQVSIPGTDLHCSLSACTDEEYADIIELVLIADSPTDVPATTIVEPTPAPASSPAPARPAPYDDATTPPTEPMPLSQGAPRAVSTLASLAELEDDTDNGEDQAAQPTPAAAVEADHAPVASMPLAPAAGSIAAATSPAQIVFPTPGATVRVSARLPQPAAPDPAAIDSPASPVPVPVPAPEPDSVPADPTVRLLGPIALEGACGTITSNRLTLALEVTAWLVLHSEAGADAPQLDEVLAPHGRVTGGTRSSRMGDVRRWLGKAPDGTHYFPQVNTQPDKRYRLVGVHCDWLQFQQLADHGSRTPGAAGEQLLRQALELVRGRPFSGRPQRRYEWADSLAVEMVVKIAHAADKLADRALEHGDARTALWAATLGLETAREMEQLWRHKFRALALLGEHDALEEAIRSLEHLLLELGATMDNDTAHTIQTLQANHR